MTIQSPKPDDWAELHSYNFSLIPCYTHTKEPALDSWTRWQSERADEDQLARWMDEYPNANIAIATGAVSGVVVLDLDSDEASALAEGRGLPETVEALSPRGRHLYFAHPGHRVPNIVGGRGKNPKLPAGIDTRGDGGYIIAASSYFVPSAKEREDGKVEGAYRWREGHSPADIAFAPMPQWLAQIVAPQPVMPVSGPVSVPVIANPTRVDAWAQAALNDELERVRSAPQGTRNDQLNVSAHSLGRLIGGGLFDEGVVRSELESAALSCGLSRSEALPTIQSGLRAGIRKPRSGPAENDDCPSLIQTPSQIAAQGVWGTLGEPICAASVNGVAIPQREWFMDEWVPAGAATTLFAVGGTGKTLAGQQIASAVASGTPLWGVRTTKAKVLAVYCEDDRNELERRQQSINRHTPVSNDTYLFWSRAGGQSSLGHFDKRTGDFIPSALYHDILNAALAIGARLVILDNITMMYSGDMNNPSEVSRFMAAMNGMALALNGAVILLGHTAKSEGSQFSGAMAWSDASRNRLHMMRDERNAEVRVLSRAKSNYSRIGDQISLIWHKGVLVRPDDVDSAELALTSAEARDNQLFLDKLDDFTARKIPLSDKKNASANYAPRRMSETQPRYFDGQLRRRMEAAMHRLLDAGTIESDAPLGFQKSNRTEARGIARASRDVPSPLRLKEDAPDALTQWLEAKPDPEPEPDPLIERMRHAPRPDGEDKVTDILAKLNARRAAR